RHSLCRRQSRSQARNRARDSLAASNREVRAPLPSRRSPRRRARDGYRSRAARSVMAGGEARGALVQTLLVAQPRDVGLGEPDRQVRRLMVVATAQDLAVPINPRQSLAVSQRDIQSDSAEFVFEPMIDQLQKSRTALSGDGGERDAVRIAQGV